jgi:hypothetical protein
MIIQYVRCMLVGNARPQALRTDAGEDAGRLYNIYIDLYMTPPGTAGTGHEPSPLRTFASRECMHMHIDPSPGKVY